MDLARNLIQRINVGDSLTRSAAARPDQPAVVDGGRRWSYAEFNGWVNQLAHGLAARGLRRGDALGLASGNSAEFLAVYFACAKLGLVCVPVNLGWRPEEVAYVLDHSAARGLVVETQLVEQVREVDRQGSRYRRRHRGPGHWRRIHGRVRRHGPDHPRRRGSRAGHPTPSPSASSATGTRSATCTPAAPPRSPRASSASHTSIYLESMGSALDSQWNHTDRFAAMMPMFHTAQLNAFCTPAVLVGATIYVLRGFDPAALLNLIEAERISQVFGLPMMYRALLDHPSFPDCELTSLRRCVYAMAPMPDALIRRCLDGFGCDFALLFGQTEMSPVSTLFRPEHQLSHIGAVGTAITGVQVAIMGPGGELLPQGERGEIVYRGPSTMTEYLHNASATTRRSSHTAGFTPGMSACSARTGCSGSPTGTRT